jgi:hypothetical protein
MPAPKKKVRTHLRRKGKTLSLPSRVRTPVIPPLTAKARRNLKDDILREFYLTLLEHTQHMRNIQAEIQRVRIAIEKPRKARSRAS